MALALRLRSNLSLFQNILKAESVYTNGLIISQNPNFATSQLSRNYATATPSKEVKVKVPLSLFGGAGNYASALYIAAVKAKVLEKVESEIVDLVGASQKSPMFSQFIKDVSVPGVTRVKAINEICSAAKFSEVTKNFLVVLAENGRLRNIDSITKKFVELTMAH
ncbi:F0F1 ATP synthase subunit delta, partial [Ralstonia pseudosolanacearum]|uniref:F0F1 ATP synthase subunit delta n=1 Tax=Ralstonia pseudosolanacearum TaxID=1310165 RepID=UPI003CF33B8B